MNPMPAILLPSSVLVYLLNAAVASIVACGLGLVLARLLRRMPLPMRHAVLVGAVMVTLVSPLVIAVMNASGIALVRVTTDDTRIPVPSDKLTSRNDASAYLSQVPPSAANMPHAIPAAPTADELPAPLPVSRTSEAPVMSRTSFWTWSDTPRLAGTLLAVAWGAGCLVSLTLIAHGLLQLRRFFEHLEPVQEGRVNEVASQAAAIVGLSTVPRIFQSRRIGAPLSVGLSRPRIVVPAEMLPSVDISRWRGLLLHEFAHVARRDHYVGLLQRIAVTLFWWNPLVRLASARISVLREQICDDVATSGVVANDGYAAMLVELAGRAVRTRSLPATIGMFDGSPHEFSDRVRRLFDQERPMVTVLTRPMKFLCAMAFVALLLLTSATTIHVQTAGAAMETSAKSDDDAKLESNASAEKKTRDSAEAYAPAVAWPAVLRGKVRDDKGKPIAGAKVRLDLEKIHQYSTGRWDELLNSQSLVTDETGEYKFDASGFPKLTHRPFVLMLSATAPNYADAKRWVWYTRSDTSVDEKFQNVKLLPGRLIEGRCVDPSGNPVVGAVVKVASDHDNDNATTAWSWDPRATNERGEFQVSVPRETQRDIELWIIHPSWAPHRVEVLEHTDRQPEIVLTRGGVLSGAVHAEDGSPVAGTVVVARSIDDGDLDTVTFAAQVAVKTDAEGRYRLPPLLGDYKVFLSHAERTDERLDDNFVVADVPPPRVVPAKVTLVSGESQRLDFRARPTLTLRGHIRWPDGRPVAGAGVRASYLPQGFGTGIELGDTETDSEGEYTFELPKPIDMISISAYGEYDENRKWHYAHADPAVEAESKGLQFIRLKNLKADRDDLDWVLRPDTE